MDFDTVIDRRNTGALKWDDPYNEKGKPDVIPLWVADMDFASPQAVVTAIQERAQHPVFGYTDPPKDYFFILRDWYETRYGVRLDPTDFLLAPGVVPSLGIAIRGLTKPGAGVLVLSPVYYPFFEIVEDNDRKLVTVSLLRDAEGRYNLDFEGMSAAIARSKSEGITVEALLFCSPHNPGGRVWSAAELQRVIDFARHESLAIVSDEIHADILVGTKPFASLAGDSERSDPPIAVIGAPNKTFNIAGLHLSHFVTRNAAVKARLVKAIDGAGYSQPNVFSIVASRAAYQKGGPWLDKLNTYLKANLDFTLTFIAKNIPGLKPVRPEGGYLVWIDAAELIRAKSLRDDHELVRELAREGRVRLSWGSHYGKEGKNYLRINIASPRSQLQEGLERFAHWVSGS